MKSTDSRPAGRLGRMPLPVRLIIAGFLVVVGAFCATACTLVATFQYRGGYLAEDPWELWFTLACTGAVASFAVPSIAWWFLLPRVRWLGTAALLALPVVWILVII